MSDILTDQEREAFVLVNFEVICISVGAFGLVANIINMIIFHKQGFGNTVNIAFFAMAISDLCSLIFMEWICMCVNPLLIVPWVRLDVAFLSASWPQVCFCRITSYITIYITMERYLSIATPLKVKRILTVKRTILVISAIYFVNIVAMTPEYVSFDLGWTFVPKRNRTLLGLLVTKYRGSLEGVENVLHSLLGMASFIGVVIVTVALVTKLKHSSEKRKELTSVNEENRGMSRREQKTVKMVALIASTLIVCYTPGVILSLTTFIVGPDFNMSGRYFNICISTWSIAYTFQTLNSSINIFFYYNMSSNYKRTLNKLLFNRCTRYLRF